MKTQITTPEAVEVITPEEITLLKETINLQWDEFYTPSELANDIEQGFIFGKYASNKHYTRDYILSLIAEIELEKNPPIVEEPVIEVVIEEPIIDVIPE